MKQLLIKFVRLVDGNEETENHCLEKSKSCISHCYQDDKYRAMFYTKSKLSYFNWAIDFLNSLKAVSLDASINLPDYIVKVNSEIDLFGCAKYTIGFIYAQENYDDRLPSFGDLLSNLTIDENVSLAELKRCSQS